MEATAAQLDTLRKLQEADRTRLQAQHTLQNLDHPARIEEIRAKLASVVTKVNQIEQMESDLNAKLDAFSEEDKNLVSKQQQIQSDIDNAAGDYRKVEALTKELQSRAKRRETVAFESERILERQSEVHQLLGKAIAARDALAKQGQELGASYVQERGALAVQIEEARTLRETLLADLPQDLLQDYERTLKKCGGVALARLTGGTCSACRSVIDESRLVQIRKEAPLSHCPHCARIMIVEGERA